MKFEKGKQYECIDWNGYTFTKGKIYTCPEDNYLIVDNGSKEYVKGIYQHFKLHEQPKLGEKVLVWDDDESLTFEMIFIAKLEGKHPYLTVKEREYLEYKGVQEFRCAAFKNMKPLPQVETVSLKEALSILEAHKGVKCRIEGCE